MQIKEYNQSLQLGQKKIPQQFRCWKIYTREPVIGYTGDYPKDNSRILFQALLNDVDVFIVSDAEFNWNIRERRNRMKRWLLENNISHSEFKVSYTADKSHITTRLF